MERKRHIVLVNFVHLDLPFITIGVWGREYCCFLKVVDTLVRARYWELVPHWDSIQSLGADTEEQEACFFGAYVVGAVQFI